MPFAGLILAVAAVSCKKEAPPPLPPPVVQVAVAYATAMPVSTEFIGQLDSPQNVEVRARVEAFVEAIPFVEGTEIKQGDLLVDLDKKPFQERLTAAEASLAEARATLNKYEKDVARLRPLVEKKAVPQQDLDNAMASVDVGKAGVLMAEARVDSAKIDLGYCGVFAPVSGLIGAKQVSVGELVGKGQPTLLATISTLDPIWFHCNISEVQYLRAETETRRTGKLLGDLAVSLILADGSTHAHSGKFVFIDRAVDVKTGTLRARVAFANPDRILRPGMFARIKVDLGTRPDCILVPERAVAELQGKTFLWVIGADNKATQRAVQVGERFEGKLRIVEGLTAGERYVLEGQQKVREGAPVTPMSPEQMSTAAAASPAASGHAGAAAGKETK
jgi:membrane fusion protein (multidrug efflux system)